MAPAPAKRSNTATVIIIVAAALIFIFLIIGILAAIAIPNLLTAQERSKQKRTMADLRSIATACEAYATDTNRFPDVRTIDELGSVLAPTYIREVPTKDAWMHDLRYECWSRLEKCDSYAVASAGKDGAFERELLQDYEKGTTAKFDGDLVFSNGEWVQYFERR